MITINAIVAAGIGLVFLHVWLTILSFIMWANKEAHGDSFDHLWKFNLAAAAIAVVFYAFVKDFK